MVDLLHSMCLYSGEALRRVCRRLSKAKQESLALDISLVALSLRPACLVDTFHPSSPEALFSDLIYALRTKSDIFQNLEAWIEPSSGNVFIVNVLKFSDHCILSSRSPRYIQLSDPPAYLSHQPSDITHILHTELGRLDQGLHGLTHLLPCGLTQMVLVPLAGFMLGYPVAYVPNSPEQEIYLSQVMLDIFQFLIVFPIKRPPDLPSEHVILQFSCPSELVEEVKISIDMLEQELQDSLPSGCGTIAVRRETVARDRIAV